MLGQQHGDGGPGIAQHLERLAADRQEYVHARVPQRSPAADPRLVGGEAEAAAGEIHRQADHLVQHVGRGELS
jgi:hypothetical protein